MTRVILGSIIGGIIAFVWAFISWTVLPWHEQTINKFSNQEFVSWVIKENVTKDGVYIAPYVESDSDKVNLTPAEVEAEVEGQEAKMKPGPYVYAQVKVGGIDISSPKLYVYSFLTQFFGALLVSLLLKRGVHASYGGRVFFVATIGLIAGILGCVPNWNWFGAGASFTLVMIADLVIQWFLVGLFLAAFVRPKPQRELMM